MDSKQLLLESQSRLEELKPILNKRFNTDRELKSHFKKYKSLYEEGKRLYDQIEKLRFELLTSKEQEK